MYKLEKCINNEWSCEGTYSTLTEVAQACLALGSSGVTEVRVTEEKVVKAKPCAAVPDLYKPEGWGTGWKDIESHDKIACQKDFVPHYTCSDGKHEDDADYYEYTAKEGPRVYIRKCEREKQND